jgi:hypothetical protein
MFEQNAPPSTGGPFRDALNRETALQPDKFLVLVHPSADERLRVLAVLAASGSIDVQDHAGR